MKKLTKAEKAKRSKSIGVINGIKRYKTKAKKGRSIGVLSGEYHKDEKSHNTKINVFSGKKLSFFDIIETPFKYIGDTYKYEILPVNDKFILKYDQGYGMYIYLSNITKLTKNTINSYSYILGKRHNFNLNINKVVIL
mgnify:CR=1 FL=1